MGIRDSEIELLDFDENEIDFKKNQEKVEKERQSSSSKKVRKTIKEKKMSRTMKNQNNNTRKMQIIFCSLSALFILGCFIFYGVRLVKYYRIYNPKAENGEKASLLATEITKKSAIVYEGSGLYIASGNYIYKGDVSNNYLKFSNRLWRIVRINSDDTIEVILDDYINMLNWDNSSHEYLKSDIYEYLNNYFIEKIDKNMLTVSSVCTDKLEDLSSIRCNNQDNSSYANLLDVTGFLNSVVDSKSFLSSADEIYWLRDSNSENVWHTNGYNVSKSTGDNFYEIKPVVTLKATTIYYGGTGTKDDPYVADKKNSLGIGSYVKLGEDTWIVYDNADNLKLVSSNILTSQHRYSYEKIDYDLEDDGSVANYLNTTYFNSLTYKDKLVDNTWYNGKFNDSYKDVLSNSVKCKVGMLNLMDMKFDSSVRDYFINTSSKEDLMYVYGSVLKNSKPIISRNIRPCISIKSNHKIVSGKGTSNDPYILEV